MLGPSLLVAPVFVPLGQETEYYIPAGRWTYYWDHSRVVEGPTWLREHVPLDEIPVWIRPGTVLCTGPKRIGRPDYEYGQNASIHAYSLQDGHIAQVRIPPQKGTKPVAVLKVVKDGSDLGLTVTEGSCELSFLGVHGPGVVQQISGGEKVAESIGYVGIKLVGNPKEVKCVFQY